MAEEWVGVTEDVDLISEIARYSDRAAGSRGVRAIRHRVRSVTKRIRAIFY